MSDPSVQNGDANTGNQQPTAAAMPDGLPESFWDADAGQVKINELIGSYSELSTFKTEADARFANRPESADKYEVRLPEGVTLPEGTEFKVDENSPLVKAARHLVFNSGGDQAAFDGIVKAYIEDALMDTANAAEIAKQEIAALGENGQARIDAVSTYAKANFPEDEANALLDSMTSAKAVSAIEKLISKAQGPGMQGQGSSAGQASITQTDLDEMQKDPRYWRDKDPEFLKKVQDGYKKLYPGNFQRVA